MTIWTWIRRGLDCGFALLFIGILSPVWLFIALCILLEDRGPVFYRQQRVGKGEQLFTLYKFRSMRVNSIPPLELGAVKHNHSLVTRIGFIIRRFKLDETPQFINVLKGEMSLIGPRPCLPERIQSMSATEKLRFHVLPGLSGWAEVNGNVELSWEEQVMLDVWYVKHASWWMDTKIFLKTIWVVIFGARKNDHALNLAKQI